MPEAWIRPAPKRADEPGKSRDELAVELAATRRALARAHEWIDGEIADRERMVAELRVAQRLEAVGQLAAGIAHEINTPIQYVSDSVYFLDDAVRAAFALVQDLYAVAPAAARAAAWREHDAEFLAEQCPKAIKRALEGLERVARIVRAMKAFAHPGSDEKAPADLNAALVDTLTVCRNEYKYVADAVTELDPALPLVPCRVAELNQVFLNLVVNAAHAIAEKVGEGEARGTIRVRTRREECAVVVTVEDDGAGIPEEVRERVFDPFFTTKPVGKGTGQGLTIARNVVVNHGGSLTFVSREGAGTSFEIRLPFAGD